MTAVDHLKLQADFAFNELLTAIEGVSEAQSWSILPEGGLDYLHTDATIHGLTLHMAGGKYMYASSAFGASHRWSELADRVASFEPAWTNAVEFLKEGHKVWMESWANLSDEDLMIEVADIRGRLVPAHKIISILTHHDGWHGGQIVMLRYAVGETEVHPPSTAEDIRTYCKDLPLW